ncbi:MAG: DUF7144 family membrane protein [Gaiellaceae bacterium]
MGTQLRGWRSFAGIIFYVVGAFNIIGGLAAIFKDEFFLANGDELLVVDYTAWGWFLLILGVIQLIVGAGILKNLSWARVVGVVLAMLSAVMHIAFLVAFPIFGLLTISLSIAVVYGLVVPSDPDEARV